MRIIREEDLENFPFLATVEETRTSGRGREKHEWDMTSKQHVLKVGCYFWLWSDVFRLTLTKCADLHYRQSAIAKLAPMKILDMEKI